MRSAKVGLIALFAVAACTSVDLSLPATEPVWTIAEVQAHRTQLNGQRIIVEAYVVTYPRVDRRDIHYLLVDARAEQTVSGRVMTRCARIRGQEIYLDAVPPSRPARIPDRARVTITGVLRESDVHVDWSAFQDIFTLAMTDVSSVTVHRDRCGV